MNSRLNRIYHAMIKRCYDKSNIAYYKYGAKGIGVCEDWRNNYQTFKSWALSHGYRDDLTIDRINNDKGYSPDNCRWATLKEQNNHRSCNLLITMDGETKTLAQWCELKKIDYYTMYKRIYIYHWSAEKAFNTQIKSMKKHTTEDIEIDGVKKSLRAWCLDRGLNYLMVWKRIFVRNWSVERALEIRS